MNTKTQPTIHYQFFHWGPFVFHTEITQEECDIIIEEGKKCRRKSNDHKHHLAGHLGEEYRFPDPGPIAGWLKKYLLAYTSAFNKWSERPSPGLNFGLTSMWINYMKAGDFNPPHNHGGDLSFVIYPDVPKEITQENKEFKGTMRGPGGISWIYGDGDDQCININHCMPVTRDLFIFPAFLKHWVFPFKSDVERVSVSGNIVFHAEVPITAS
jgi:hypothetical protein